ncbi:MAG: hypothetical protein ABJA78_10365 [Ferruginibacter sp.]
MHQYRKTGFKNSIPGIFLHIEKIMWIELHSRAITNAVIKVIRKKIGSIKPGQA